METRQPLILDMTPEGQFTTPAPPGRVDRALGRVLRVALLVTGVAAVLMVVALAVVAISILLPVLLAAGAISAGILWWRMRRGGGVPRFVVMRRP